MSEDGLLALRVLRQRLSGSGSGQACECYDPLVFGHRHPCPKWETPGRALTPGELIREASRGEGRDGPV